MPISGMGGKRKEAMALAHERVEAGLVFRCHRHGGKFRERHNNEILRH